MANPEQSSREKKGMKFLSFAAISQRLRKKTAFSSREDSAAVYSAGRQPKQNPEQWWGRLQEQTTVWETDPPAKNQAGQQRGKDLKSPRPFLIHWFPLQVS